MRRRREWPLLVLLLPTVLAFYENAPRGYEANPIGPEVPADPAPYLPPRAPVARGYQPPPQPALFEPPRSYYIQQHHQHHGHGHMPSIANPPPRPSTDWARPQRPLDEAAERQLLYEAERRLMTMRAQRPRFDEDEYLLKAVGAQSGEGAHQPAPQTQPRTPSLPLRHPEPPHRLIYTPKFNTGPPAAAPPRPAPSFRPQNPVVPPRILPTLPPPPTPSNEEIQVEPASVDLSSLEKNPPDVENNIIVHIFLNAKETKKPVHATTKIGPVHGVFGIGTAHGGPGTHQNPIVIVKDFDRDRLKFVDENTALKMIEEGPANIVEVKAMVSTPDRKIEATLNRAVNTELDRAIPMVLNRFHGAMTAMDGDLRKELEQALVDEIAKNLGETIDSMSAPGEVTEDDLGKLIEDGFNEVTESTTVAPTRKITVVTMTSSAPPTRVTSTEAPPTTRQTTMRIRVQTTVGTRRTEAPTTTWVEVTATKATPTQATPTTRRRTEAPPTPRRTEAPPTERPTWRTEEPTVWTELNTEPTEGITEAPPTPRRTEAPPTPRRTEAPPTPRRTEALPTSRRTQAPPTEPVTEPPTRRTRPTTVFTPPTQRRTEAPPTEAPPTEAPQTETPPTPRRTEAPATRITRPPVKVTEAPEEEPETPRHTEAPTQAPPTSRKTPPTPYTWPQPPLVHETPEPETPEPIPETPPAWWTEAPATETTGTTQTPPPRTFRIKTTAAQTTAGTTTEAATTEAPTRPAEPEITTTGYVVPKETTARATQSPPTTTGYILPKEPETKVSIDFHHEVEATTHKIAVNLPTVRPAPPTSSEEDFNIVTSQPVHVVDLSSHEEVSGELEPTSKPVTSSSSQAPPTKATPPSVPIFNEGAFETTTTSTAEPTVTVTAEVTVAAGTVRPQKTIEHSMEKIEESAEEKEEEKFRGITRRPPSSFGDMNMMRQTTRGGAETQTTSETQTTKGDGETQTTRARVETQTEEPFEKSRELFEKTTTIRIESGESAEKQTVPGSETQTTVPPKIETETTAPWWSLTHSTTLQMSTEKPETQTTSQIQTTRARAETQTPPPAREGTRPVETQPTRLPFVTPDLSAVQSTEQPPFAPTWQTVPSSHEIDEIAPKGACPTPNDPSDKRRADVLFLLDSSNKFTEDKFMHAITLILDTVERLRNIGSEGVQVSLVQFNSEPYLEFSLRKHDCKQFLKDDIADTQYMTGGRMLGRALDKVTKFAFTRKRGDRPDAENILVILTDGQSEDHVQLPVKVSKDENVTVYVIGTLEANPEYLKNLAGNQDNVFQLNGTAHKPLAEQLAGKISKIGDSREKSAEEEPMDVVQHRRPVDMNDISSEEPSPLPIVPQEHTGVVHLDCTTEGFKMKLNLPGRFAGHMVVKGFEKDPNCQLPIRATDFAENRTLDFFVASESCGVTRRASEHPKGRNTSVVVQLVHAPKLRTGEDRAFLLQCFVGVPDHDDEVSTRLDVVKGEVTVAETISLSSLPPTCNYSIRKDRPDGPVVTKAVVGQAVYHRWDCDSDEKANNVYGIKVHSCFASDDVQQKYPIVDVRGCSSDLALLTNPVYDEEKLSAYALSHVFGVLEADSLKFVCKLSLCTRDGDGCEGITPPMCSDNHTDLLVWKKAEAPDAALTSALMTEVDIGKEGAVTRAAHAVADSKILLALAAALLFVTAATVVARKVTRRPPTSPTISTRASSQFEGSGSSSSSESQHSGAVPDPRLADFLKTFDRSRYV